MESDLEIHGSWLRPRQKLSCRRVSSSAVPADRKPLDGPFPSSGPSGHQRESRTQTWLRWREAVPGNVAAQQMTPKLSEIKPPFIMLTRPAGQKLEQGPALFRASARRFMLCGWGHLGPRTPGLARGLGAGTAGAP